MPDANQDTNISPTDDDIRIKAYDLWIEDGQPHGKHDEHWHRAKTSLTKDGSDSSDGKSSPDAQSSDSATSTVTPIRKGRKTASAA